MYTETTYYMNIWDTAYCNSLSRLSLNAHFMMSWLYIFLSSIFEVFVVSLKMTFADLVHTGDCCLSAQLKRNHVLLSRMLSAVILYLICKLEKLVVFHSWCRICLGVFSQGKFLHVTLFQSRINVSCNSETDLSFHSFLGVEQSSVQFASWEL